MVERQLPKLHVVGSNPITRLRVQAPGYSPGPVVRCSGKSSLGRAAWTRVNSVPGFRAPLHCSGVGKVLLAYSSPEDIESYIEKTDLPAYTINTIANPYIVREELTKIRAQSFAVGNGEWQLSVVAIAAAVR